MVLTTTNDGGNATQGRGVPDHQVFPIGGAQHAQAFCQLFRGFTARAVCQLASPRPCGGAQFHAASIGCTKAPGGYPQRVLYQGPAVGPR